VVEYFQSAGTGHADIEKGKVELIRIQRVESGLPIRDFVDPVALGFEGFAQYESYGVFIVCDEDRH
jgi:hypothetical protein